MNICWKDAETNEIVDVEYVLLDGYSIGDRFLEGVQFRCKPFLDEKGTLDFEVSLGADEQSYLKGKKASVAEWCEEMRQYAVGHDIYTHPESGRDLYYDLGE
jgi:hypothetical protein